MFDGDEMNIFVPQSIQTRIELEEIANVKKQIITPSTSLTIIGIVQDGLLGAYNLTKDSVRLDWRTAMNIMSYTSAENLSSLKKGEEYKGSDLFSLIIPPKINIKRDDLEIKDGKIVKGQLKKKMLGSKEKNNLIQYIWDEYGENETTDFIDNVQRLVNNFNLWNGFSVGIGDTYIKPEIREDIRKYIKSVTNKVDIDVTNIENNPQYMTEEMFERKIFNDMNVIRDDVSKMVMDNIPDTNSFGIMINSKSKGGPVNLGQMVGCVGLQSFEGSLYNKRYAGRTLAYFHENDDSSASRGLVTHSYKDGMTFPEFVYHTAAGREGIIDQVVKTSETGYAQRKLIKTMEDVMIRYDGTVRIANNQVIQQTYGGNGADTTKQYDYKIQMIQMDNKKLEERFVFTKDQLKNYKDFSEKDNEILHQKIRNMRDELRKDIVKARMSFITMNDQFMLPVNLSRILSSIKKNPQNPIKLSPHYILDSLEDVLSIRRTPLLHVKEEQKINEIVIQDEMVGKHIMRIGLYDCLNPKVVNEEYGMTKEEFDQVLIDIQTNHTNNIIEPGEMIGVISAQSLGEAVTQMTLNAFHHSGIATLTHSTMGVPRINELISATKNPKTPQMFIYLSNEHKESREMAHKIGSYLEKTTMGDIRGKLDVYYDPEPYKKGGLMERDGVSEPFYSKKLSRSNCQASIDNLPWVIRIEINKEKMLDKEVTLLDIKSKFCIWWDRKHVNTKKKKEKVNSLKNITSFAMLSNNDNDLQPVVHIRFNAKDLDKSQTKKMRTSKFNRETIIDFVNLIDKFKLKGTDGVDKINGIVGKKYLDVEDGDKMAQGDEYVLYTSGVNLREIRNIIGVDCYKTFSDNVQAMYSAFGIEVARNRLMNEFLIAYENAGNNVNPQHVALLVDIMCYDGTVISADRHGMKKSNIDPLSKASFEKTIDVLLSAAVFGDTDKMNGVSSRIMAGQVIKGGTGYCELELDVPMIQNSEYVDKDYDNLETEQRTIANSILHDEEGENIYIPE